MQFLDHELAAINATDITQKPKPFVPFATPMRMTDNAKCSTTNPGGEYLYDVWAQMLHDAATDELVEFDPIARRSFSGTTTESGGSGASIHPYFFVLVPSIITVHFEPSWDISQSKVMVSGEAIVMLKRLW